MNDFPYQKIINLLSRLRVEGYATLGVPSLAIMFHMHRNPSDYSASVKELIAVIGSVHPKNNDVYSLLDRLVKANVLRKIYKDDDVNRFALNPSINHLMMEELL